MNKRQTKKRDKKLYKAIRELNEDLIDLVEFNEIDEVELQRTFEKIRKCPHKINSVFKDYSRFILNR